MRRAGVIFGVALAVCFAYVTVAAQPGGGKTSPAKPAAKPATRSTAKPPSTGTPTTRTAPARAAIASIDGKWWTSGNDFGASEVLITQTGANVSGDIHYSDGRTGTLTGTLVGKRIQHRWMNSSGESGSGWLELSWNNFLGGAWRNERVRDGSWTLMRIEGKWCFSGSRNRIRTVTHNARGDVLSIAEDGTRSTGRLDGPWLYLTSDDGMTIKGEMDFRSNRMNWSTGFFWTWCGRN